MHPLCLAICGQTLIASHMHCLLPPPSSSPTSLDLFEHTKLWLYSYILITDWKITLVITVPLPGGPIIVPSVTAEDMPSQGGLHHSVGIHGYSCILSICTGSCSITCTSLLMAAVVSIPQTQMGLLSTSAPHTVPDLHQH